MDIKIAIESKIKSNLGAINADSDQTRIIIVEETLREKERKQRDADGEFENTKGKNHA